MVGRKRAGMRLEFCRSGIPQWVIQYYKESIFFEK